MTFDFIFALALGTLIGGVLHAAYNLYKTKKLHEKGINPDEIPEVYQKYDDPRRAAVGIEKPEP
jgi:hypothetical protein